jgi:peptide/nickel transport system ATP-binding protein
MSALVINWLRVDATASGHDIVDEVYLEIEPGEVLALVGESGSGKTKVGLAVLGYARKGVTIAGGSITINDREMLALSVPDLRRARGDLVTYVPQDPSTALNPALRIGTQLMEVLEYHDFGGSAEARRQRVVECMAEVLLPSTRDFLRRYPHQLSGGQQQRVGLAMAFACRPAVIVLDEPTTGLDVSTQAHVLATVRDLCRRHSVAALYITHDLAVVATLADRVAVMYAGRIVEQGPTASLFARPAHPYSRHLIAAAPDITGQRTTVGLRGRAPSPGRRPKGCAFALRCEFVSEECTVEFPAVTEIAISHTVRCIKPWSVPVAAAGTPASAATGTAAVDAALVIKDVSASYTGHAVVHDIDLHVEKGGGLHHEWTGEILLGDTALAHSARHRSIEQRMKIQYVFQNPYSSLNPRRIIGDSLARPLVIAGASRSEAAPAVNEMLERVSLTAAYASRYPDQLSGGERQRVAIARALVSRPDLLVCDEVTSALDVLVQAAIVDLLADLQRDLGLSMLFVTHNLPLVRSIARRVAVMSDGRIVEFGDTEQVLGAPQQEYTQRLLADTPQVPVYS